MTNNAVPPVASNQSERVSDEVMQVLQLRAQPFNDDPSDGDWFVDDTTRDQLQVIRNALVTGDDLLLISGHEGSGKTVLLKQFSSSSGARLQCMSVRGSEHFVTRDLFAGLLKVFKLKPPLETPDILNEVIPCLQAWTERNTLGVIVLDDADAVPDQELTSLLEAMKYLNGGGEVLLKILLAAKPDFEPRIPTLLPPGSDLPYSALAMEALDLERSRDYLEFRLNQAGNFDKAPFSDREIQSIFETSGGLPAHLNRAAAAELNIKHDGSAALATDVAASSPLQNKTVKTLLGLLGLGLILAGLYQFLPKSPDTQDSDNYTIVAEKPIVTGSSSTATSEQPTNIALLNESPTQIDSPTTTTEVESESPVTDADSTQAEDSSANAESDATATVNTNNDNSSGSTANQDAVANSGDDGTQAPVGGESADAATASATNPIVSPTPTTTTAATDSDTADEGDAGPTGNSAAESSSTQTSGNTGDNDAATDETDSSAAEQAEPDTTEGAEPDADSVGDIESANWVLLQKPNQFTVQLSSSTDLESIQSFLRRTGLGPPNSIFSYKQGNVTRYALVHGLFPTTQAASAAIEKMDPFARRDQPWIRSLRQIQNSLKPK